jgi:acid phosphatase (class A)
MKLSVQESRESKRMKTTRAFQRYLALLVAVCLAVVTGCAWLTPSPIPAEDEAKLAKNGSYPSGHTSVGWAWALILAEIAPERADAILSRGYSFGRSRVVCGVHWQSDVHAGRVIAAAVVAKLHSDPVFLAQLAAAGKELAAVRAKGFKPANDCEAEAAALAFK